MSSPDLAFADGLSGGGTPCYLLPGQMVVGRAALLQPDRKFVAAGLTKPPSGGAVEAFWLIRLE